MPRTIIVGDLHACRAELEALLAKVSFAAGDELVMVGDLVVRGPDPRGALDLLARLGARAVRGNHDDRVLRVRADPDKPASYAHRETAAQLEPRHWAFLSALPLWLDLPEHGVRVVHAGVVPGLAIEEQEPRTLMYVRSLGPSGEPSEKRGEVLWGARYRGPPHLVFGHNAMDAPQIHRDATGIDTGAVYGNRLTAMVLAAGAEPPPPADRRDALVSVPSKQRYADD